MTVGGGVEVQVELVEDFLLELEAIQYFQQSLHSVEVVVETDWRLGSSGGSGGGGGSSGDGQSNAGYSGTANQGSNGEMVAQMDHLDMVVLRWRCFSKWWKQKWWLWWKWLCWFKFINHWICCTLELEAVDHADGTGSSWKRICHLVEAKCWSTNTKLEMLEL